MFFMLVFMRGSVENPIYSILKLGNTKLDKIVTELRFYIPWILFMSMNNQFMDIKITSISNKSTYTWYLRKDKRVGNYKFNNDLTSLTLTFYYLWFQNFLNNFIELEIQKFYKNKDEICNFIKIEKHWFNSFNEESLSIRNNPIRIEQISEWKYD